MEFKKLVIENFRNFSSIEIDLSNKNVIFGMNDSGKTNLLFAIRYLLIELSEIKVSLNQIIINMILVDL